MPVPWKESSDKSGQHIKKQIHYFANRSPSSQSYSFSNICVQMWQLDHKEGWELKDSWFLMVVLEEILESPLDRRKIKSVNPNGNKPWIFIGSTLAEAKAPRLWLPDVKNWITGKDPDAGKDWRQEEKGMTEDEVVGWHHWLNGHEFEQTPEVGYGQGSLVCYSTWDCRVGHDWGIELKWRKLEYIQIRVLLILYPSLIVNKKRGILRSLVFRDDSTEVQTR